MHAKCLAKQMMIAMIDTINLTGDWTREPTENLIDHEDEGESLNTSRAASVISPPNTPPANVAQMDEEAAATKIQV